VLAPITLRFFIEFGGTLALDAMGDVTEADKSDGTADPGVGKESKIKHR
jgi:hypothetical protein